MSSVDEFTLRCILMIYGLLYTHITFKEKGILNIKIKFEVIFYDFETSNFLNLSEFYYLI